MKVIILAGGKGTRISEYTREIPKPMIRIGGKPIILHIIKLFQSYNFNEIIIATGYKSHIIKNYFKNKSFGWKIKIIDTGKNTMTGGRVKRLKNFLKNFWK